MFPILPFVAGVVIGASALRVYRKAQNDPRLGKAVERAGRKIRAAALSGLESIQETSARWQNRLASAPAEETPPAAAATGASGPALEEERGVEIPAGAAAAAVPVVAPEAEAQKEKDAT
jgi:hypothetical protein